MTRQRATSSPASSDVCRRGTAYVFVLSICLIVTVLGMGALTLSRVSAKSVGEGNDWETAGTLAFSATEQAISVLNAAAAAAPSTWRSSYVSGQTAYTQTVGRGTMSWAIKDEVDGNLNTDRLRAFRLYGIGQIGAVTRVYSVQVIPGGSPLDVLRTALHSDAAVTLTGTTQAINGPISSNSSVQLGGAVNGAIEAPSTSGSASGTQTITMPAPAKTMPSTSIFNDLLPNATTIDFSSLSGGKITKCLISPASNPWGTPNVKGLYYINIGGGTLKISSSRIVGTLLIAGTSSASVQITGPVEWEPGPLNEPIIMVSGSGIDVTLAGSSTWLSESSAGVNFNPPSTPFNGASDSDTSDDLPPQYRGLIHLMVGTTGSLRLIGNVYVKGTIIADCPTQTNSMGTFIQDPAIYASPPLGYSLGDAMVEMPGTWKWDTLP